MAPPTHSLDAQLDAIRNFEGVNEPRDALTLWALRALVDLDSLDSYEYVLPPTCLFSERTETSIDALTLTGAEGDLGEGLHGTVVLVEGGMIRLKAVVSALREIRQDFTLASGEIRRLFRRGDIEASAVQDWDVLYLANETIASRQRTAMTDVGDETIRVRVFGRRELEAWAHALVSPQLIDHELDLHVADEGSIYLDLGDMRVAVMALPGKDLAEWPGIADRSLFDLNVRDGLGMNRVRRSLDEALTKKRQDTFVAGHNGLTVIVEEMLKTNGGLRINKVSVVNGAQTMIALWENRETLTDELKLLVKFIQLDDLDKSADIAVNSNTQNPVTTRSLRAHDRTQLRLRQELAKHVDYRIRPGKPAAAGIRVVNNDEIAQLLCGVILKQPWMAVKRDVLFGSELYFELFPEDIDSDLVLWLYELQCELDRRKSEFPALYTHAWKLTRLTAAFLVGVWIRAFTGDRKLASASARSSRMRGLAIDAVIGVLRAEPEDPMFRVSFKNRARLLELEQVATKSGILASSRALS